VTVSGSTAWQSSGAGKLISFQEHAMQIDRPFWGAGKLISFQEHAMQIDRPFWITLARVIGLVIVAGIVLLGLDLVTPALFTK